MKHNVSTPMLENKRVSLTNAEKQKKSSGISEKSVNMPFSVAPVSAINSIINANHQEVTPQHDNSSNIQTLLLDENSVDNRQLNLSKYETSHATGGAPQVMTSSQL